MEVNLKKTMMLILVISMSTYSGFATYQWVTIEKNNKILIDYIVSQTDLPIAIVGDMGPEISYLLDTNVSKSLLNAKLHLYFTNVRTLSYSAMMLYQYTKNDKYLLMRTSMKNLESFLLSSINSQDTRKILYNNIDTLEGISSIIKELRTIKDITLEKAERLLNLTNNLKYENIIS